jgi:simple sugar transport system permease protein
MDPYVAALITLACGALIGMLNGLITVKAKVVSFVATLGAMLSWRGLSQILSGGAMRSVALDQHPFFVQLLTGRLGGIVPVQGIWFVLFAVILFFVLNRGRFGNWIYATGDNRQAARAMAVDTDLVKIVCFVVVGSLVAFASMIQTVRVTSFNTHMATGWELQAVAAAVVGGTSLLGGRGSMVGVFLGALVIMVIDNMIGQARLASEWTYMAFGLVLLGAALLDLVIEKQVQRASAA